MRTDNIDNQIMPQRTWRIVLTVCVVVGLAGLIGLGLFSDLEKHTATIGFKAGMVAWIASFLAVLMIRITCTQCKGTLKSFNMDIDPEDAEKLAELGHVYKSALKLTHTRAETGWTAL